MKRFLFIIVLLIICFVSFPGDAANGGDNIYRFYISRAAARLLDNIYDGIELEVTCERISADGRTGNAKINWYIQKDEFSTWPPSKPELKTKIIAYLEDKIGSKRRLDIMIEQSDKPVISNEDIPFLLNWEFTITQ